jgi:hypothetical protein
MLGSYNREVQRSSRKKHICTFQAFVPVISAPILFVALVMVNLERIVGHSHYHRDGVAGM